MTIRNGDDYAAADLSRPHYDEFFLNFPYLIYILSAILNVLLTDDQVMGMSAAVQTIDILDAIRSFKTLSFGRHYVDDLKYSVQLICSECRAYL